MSSPLGASVSLWYMNTAMSSSDRRTMPAAGDGAGVEGSESDMIQIQWAQRPCLREARQVRPVLGAGAPVAQQPSDQRPLTVRSQLRAGRTAAATANASPPSPAILARADAPARASHAPTASPRLLTVGRRLGRPSKHHGCSSGCSINRV
ncbi:hypothetical protein ZWY2020_025936 [Hordeum vulgare]|nr:hypothetical protein ZWY2020_025936 [Hordeum vulgare]